MSAKAKCPKCTSDMMDTGHSTIQSLCSVCGHIPKVTKIAIDQRLERFNLNFIIGFSVVVVVGFMQLASWGNHAIEIRWLQFADLVGFASVANFDQMAKICTDLKKHDCVEYSYRRQSQLDKKNIARLADFQLSRHKFTEALQTIKPHLGKNGKDLRLYMIYAQALTEVGRYNEAAKYYEYLMAKSRTLPAEVTQKYVTCLARAKRFDQAQRVILNVRKSYPGKGHFMDGEYRVLAGLKSANAR